MMTGLTDPGRIRDGNEDCIATRPDIGLAILADGMGGHLAGEVASRMAVEIVTRHFAETLNAGSWTGDDAAGAITDAIHAANLAIYEAARARPECAGMGSTIVVALFAADRMWVGHVGDSRLYRLRAGTLTQLTQDHSVIQELVNRGLFTLEEARQTVAKNLVTRALGVEAGIAPDISAQTTQPGDVYLLCSDGLNEVLTDAEIAAALAQPATELTVTAQRLVDLANERGGPDNISVILAQAGAAATS
mgnify:CR=1 FL=1